MLFGCTLPNRGSLAYAENLRNLACLAENINFDILVFIQPTSPLIKLEYINRGVKMVMQGSYDSVFTGTKDHWIPKWDMHIKPIDWDINNRPMRQDKPESYVENGMFYVTTKKCLLSTKLRYGGNIGVLEIPLKDSFQIDTLVDLELVENRMSLR